MAMALQPFQEYDPAWEASFLLEKERLLQHFVTQAQSIHHIGSTAIPGMPGKGIIDILITVTSLEPTEFYTTPLTALGYINRPVPERPESPFFTKPAERPRTHNVHIALTNSLYERSHLAFRDYLISHPTEAAVYADAKRALTRDGYILPERYSVEKASVASDLAQRAMAWAQRLTLTSNSE